MIVDIVMPKMGESITEGTIIEWRKKVGDAIKMDEIILEIGTDKVDSEIPSSTDGVLIEIIGKPNDVMEVGAVIARVETDSKASVIEKPVEEKEDIVVDEKVKGKMLGTQLVKELIKVGEAKGCYRISLFCDKKLVKFYERNGFKVNNVMMKRFIKNF